MTELDVEALVLRHLQNVTLVSDGKKLYSGYVDGEEEYLSFLTDMKALGFSFYSRTSTTNKSSRILFTCEKRNADINIPYFGSPFQIVKSIYMMCSKDGRYIPSTSKLMAQDPLRKTRTPKQPSKKVGCAAFMSVKCLRVFNEDCYRLDSPYKRICSKKKKILATLNQDLLSPSPPVSVLRFMIIMSPAGDHNHSVVSTNLKQILHPRLRSEIHNFVQSNVCSVKTIKMHLNEVVKSMFENGDGPQPDILNRCYYPTDHVIRFHMHQGLCSISKSWYDQAALEGCIKIWEEEYLQDNFFFRPYKVEGNKRKEGRTLLFCHQTTWQRDLLRRYGNCISLLDPAYRTCRYGFPLYFLLVKTNSGDCVVGTLVVQVGSATLLQEALSQFKAWNPTWAPKFFLVDNSAAEIAAVEKSFPRSTVYVCSYHRELAWDRWLNKRGNVSKQSIGPIKQLWQTVAASQTEQEFNENIQVMYDGEYCEFSELANTYFTKEWLPVNCMWVEAYQAKEFLSNIKINNGIECQNKILEHSYLTNTKDKTLTGVITLILDQLLPDVIDKYSLSNPCPEYIIYDESVPQFLRDRPLPFIESVMLRWESGKELDATQINDLGDGLFMVRSEPGVEEWCSVDFQEPTCSCPDFNKWRLPCKHMCAVFVHTAWHFERLPSWYRENPYVTCDPSPPPEEPVDRDAEEPIDVRRVWDESRDKLQTILGYTHLQYSTDDVLRFSNTISTLEEEMRPEEPNLSIQMHKMKTLKHVKRKFLDIPQSQYDMNEDWQQYKTESGDSIDQIVIIDMM